MMSPSKMEASCNLIPSLSSTAIPGDPYDHHGCAYHAACCPYRRHPDPPRAAAVELRGGGLLEHRRHHGAQWHLSFHPLIESPPPTRICALAPTRAAVLIKGEIGRASCRERVEIEGVAVG